jgi:hypothetical protein
MQNPPRQRAAAISALADRECRVRFLQFAPAAVQVA